MCGILGIISNTKLKISKEDFALALGKITHRGPDDRGVVEIGGRGFLGLTRLSIIDLSETGHQPMSYTYHGRNLKIIFNGEIYNYIELRKELVALGHEFSSQTDTEVIMASYLAWGENCLERFNGMFAFAIWDEENEQIFAARDRMGKKPFLYSTESGDFVFASEIKVIKELGFKPVMDRNKFQEYLLSLDTYYFGRSDTFYENIKSLPGGSWIKWNHGKLDIAEWWSPKEAKLPFLPDSVDGITDKIHSLLRSATSLRLRSDVPVALALSGGVDSSSILSLLSELQKKGSMLHTFTVCHPGRDTDEKELVEKLIESFPALNIQSHFFNFPTEINNREMEEFVSTHDEPVRNFDVYNQFFLMKKIHESGIKVLLSGQGADELFWGYPRYYLKAGWTALTSFNFPYFFECLKYVSRFHNISRIKALRKVVFSALRSPFGSEREKKISSLLKEPGVFADQDTHREASDLKGFQIQEITRTHLPSLLRDEDRNSMKFSIESRAPFMDFRIVELALNLPVSLNLRGGVTKYALRKAFDGRVPEEISWRKSKSGLYEKRTIKYVNNFPEIAKKAISASAFIRENVKIELIPYDDLELVWRLYNVAILDLTNENQLSTLQ